MSPRSSRSASLLPLVLSMTLFAVATVLALPLVGQAVAVSLSTGRWVWPRQPLPASWGLLHGHTGLAVTGRAPSTSTVWVCTAVIGVLLVTVFGVLGWLLLSGASAKRGGFAGAAEARRIVGVGRLRSARRELRPDIHQRGRFDPAACGVGIGRRGWRGGIPLWSRADRTVGVVGPQGCGKSLDLLLPALISCPGAAVVTLTKPQDLLLVWAERARDGRPVLVLDPFDLVPGLPRLVWDPITGCADATTALRRAKAFAAGTIRGAVGQGAEDAAARFYAAEAVKVLAAFFHAAALTGRGLVELICWVAKPDSAEQAAEILRRHPMAEPHMAEQLSAALNNTDPRTAGNTRTTVHQAMEPFLQSAYRARFTPSEEHPATDVAEVLRRGGTIFLLGREDPYSSATPLMTAVVEHVIETARWLAEPSPLHRLAPWMLCVLDELPSTAPIPSLPVSMANDRALGIAYLWASQTRHQLYEAYGRKAAESVIALTNNLVIFGGGKDPELYRDIAELLGDTRTPASRYRDPDYRPVVQRGELRQLKPGRALLIAEHARGILVRLQRCIDGHDGQQLLQQAAETGAIVERARSESRQDTDLGHEAVAWSRANGLVSPGSAR